MLRDMFRRILVTSFLIVALLAELPSVAWANHSTKKCPQHWWSGRWQVNSSSGARHGATG